MFWSGQLQLAGSFISPIEAKSFSRMNRYPPGRIKKTPRVTGSLSNESECILDPKATLGVFVHTSTFC